MEKLKKLLLSFALIFASAFVLTASASAAGVKESVEDFTGDVYIIGSTKFDNNTSVTASRAAQAGSDEMLLQIINGNFEFQRNKIKTYLYSEIEELWFEVPKNGGELIELTETEVEAIEDNLNIYFVNDNEKMIEFEYTGDVDASTITSTDSLSGAEVRYEGGKFYIPVTTVELKFETTTGEKVSVVTEYDEEEEKIDFGEFYIPITVTVLDADGEIIPDLYVQTTKEGKIGSVDYLLNYPGESGYQVYYIDENGLPIDFDTFVVTEPISIKQAWTPRGTLHTESSTYENSATEIVHTGNIYEDENGTYIKAFLLAPKGYDTTNTKVNGEAATFVDERMNLKLYFESISDVKEVEVEWEEGIEVTFEVSIDPEEAEYAYTVKYYDDKNQEIETHAGVTQGTALEEPKYTYEKVDYVFDGWTTDVETNVKYDFTNGVNANLKLYPRFVTLKEFVENSNIENPAVLRSNVTTTTTALITKDADMVLDLGGYTITMNSNTDDIIRMKGNNASLTIKSGKMIAGGYAAAVVIGKSKEDTSSVTKRDLTIANDVVIEADYYGIAAFGKSKVDFYGTLNLSEAGYAISGNGLENNEGTLFNIYDGSEISAPNGIVLYLPQLGETNILGGTLTGSTVVGIKAGTLNVSGGTLTSTGDYVAPKPTNDGMDFTGDVIIAEENSFYADHIQINITGGKLVKEGEGTALIREYNPSLGTENERYVKVKGLYAFKTKVDDITYVFAESTSGDFVYDETYYAKEELQTYLEKSSETKPVVITKDITLTKDMIINVDADMVLDLGGKTITSEVDIIRLKGNNSSLVVKNGTMITTGNSSAPLKIGASQEDTTDVTKREIVVMADVVLNTNGYGVALFGKSKLDMYGKIIVNGAGYGISGNGLKNNEGTLINIYEGAEISAPNSAALYLPQLGETNIYGGTFTGNSVIGIKAGTLNITGGTFTSTGDYVAPKPTNDGMDATGDVIIAEENSAYADHIQINITGATLTANGKDTALIREYNPSLGTENERYVTVRGAYATRNTTEEAYTFVYTSSELAKLEVNGVKYTEKDLKIALENSSGVSPVVLLAPITLTETIVLDKDAYMVLDLGGKTITSEVDIIRLKGNNTFLQVQNGTMITTGNSSAPLKIGASQEDTTDVTKREIVVMEDVVLNTNGYGVAVFGKSKLDMYGKIIVNGAGYGISGNGLKNNEGTLINIYEGAEISAPNSAALYLPQLGETNIYGGTFTGYSVIGIKAGTLNITGGTFTSTGDYVAPKPTNDGMDATGDVIIAEENSAYADHIQINITGATLTANGKDTALIREYNPSLGTENERYVTVTGAYATKNKVDDITFTYTKTVTE